MTQEGYETSEEEEIAEAEFSELSDVWEVRIIAISPQ